MSMAELVAAGAPELPEGYFYRVRNDRFGWPEVQIRKVRKRFGSRGLTYALVRLNEHETVEGAVVAACAKAVQRMDEDAQHWKRQRQASTYLGDHDPRGGR
jgi:hypothetical protein